MEVVSMGRNSISSVKKPFFEIFGTMIQGVGMVVSKNLEKLANFAERKGE